MHRPLPRGQAAHCGNPQFMAGTGDGGDGPCLGVDAVGHDGHAGPPGEHPLEPGRGGSAHGGPFHLPVRPPGEAMGEMEEGCGSGPEGMNGQNGRDPISSRLVSGQIREGRERRGVHVQDVVGAVTNERPNASRTAVADPARLRCVPVNPYDSAPLGWRDPSGGRDHGDVVTDGALAVGELRDVDLDPAETGQVAIADVGDPHWGTMVRCRTRSCRSTPTPTMKRCSPGGLSPGSHSEGHRVVLVTATAGEAGLTSAALAASGDLAERRIGELRAAAAALGCHDVRILGYDDSGMDGRAGRAGLAFSRVDVEEAAGRLAQILTSVGADVLTVYDAAGGYGHPDHVQVHRVGVRAAELAATPVVLEATVDRGALLRLLVWLRRLRLLRWAPAEWQPERLAGSYTDPARLTHKVDVRRFDPGQAGCDGGLRLATRRGQGEPVPRPVLEAAVAGLSLGVRPRVVHGAASASSRPTSPQHLLHPRQQ